MKTNFFLGVIFFSLFLSLQSCKQGGTNPTDDFPLKSDLGQSNNTTSETNTSKAEVSIDEAPSYNFSTKLINTTNTRTIVLRNTSGYTATNLSASGLAAPFAIYGGTFPGSGGSCASSLANGQTCTIVVEFSPTAVGSATDALVVVYKAGSDTKSVRLFLNGEGVAGEITSVSNNPYSFGNVTIDATGDATITIKNSGKYTASSFVVTGMGDAFSYKGGTYPGTGGTCDSSLTASSTCTMKIQFNPTDDVSSAITLNFAYDNGDDSATATIGLSGTGIIPADLDFTVGTVSLGTIALNASSTATVSVTYAGDTIASTVSASAFSNASFTYLGGNYPGTNGTCGTSIGNDCEAVVKFTPTSVGSTTDTLELVYYNGADTATASIILEGKTPPSVEWVQSTPLDIGYCANSTSCDVTISMQYVGYNGATSVSTLTADFLSGSQGIDFKGGSYPGVPGGDCGSSLSFVSDSCDIVLRFSPTTKGEFSDTLQLSYYDSLATQTANLVITGRTYYSDRRVQFGTDTASGTLSAAGDEEVTGLALDDSSNLYMVGFTTADIMGNGIGGTYDAFLMKFDMSGDFTDITQPAGIDNGGDDFPADVAFDPNTGAGILVMAGSTTGDYTETNGGGGFADIFLTTFNKSLVTQNAVQLGQTTVGGGSAAGNEVVYDLAIDEDNSLYYVCGSTTGNVEAADTASGIDALVTAFDNTLAFLWASQISAGDVATSFVSSVAGTQTVRGCAVDATGDVLLAGTTSGSLAEATAGNTDVFLAKLSAADGTPDWITQLGSTTLGATYGADHDYVNALLIDTLDNAWVVGTTASDIDGIGIDGNTDIFVARFTNRGEFQKAYKLKLGSDGAGTEVVTGASLDPFGNIYISGYTDGGLQGGTNGGNNDIFLVKFRTQYGNEGFEVFQESSDYAIGDDKAGINACVVNDNLNIFVGGTSDADYAETNGGGIDALLMIKNYSDFTTTPYAWLSFGMLNSSGNETFSFGTCTVFPTNYLLTLKYIGDGAGVTSVSPSFSNASAGFSFNGGAFPGTGGNCATTINADCTLDIKFNPATAGSKSSNLIIRYTSGGATRTTTLVLSGVK